MKKLLGVVAIAGLALTGCGNACDEMASATDVYITKASPCLDDPPDAFNITQCDRTLDKCTDSEKEALSAYADCLSKLPECTPGSKGSFNDALTACALGIKGKVGDNCARAL